MAVKRTPTGRWLARCRAAGLDVQHTFDNEVDAVVWHARAREAALAGRALPRPVGAAVKKDEELVEETTLRAVIELADRYHWSQSVDGEKSMRRAVRLCRMIGLDTAVSDLTSRMIAEAVQELQRQGITEETVRKHVTALRGAFREYSRASDRAVPALHWPKLKRAPEYPRPLSSSEVEQLAGAMQSPYSELFIFLTETGLAGPSEWTELRWTDLVVDGDRTFIRVRGRRKGNGAPMRLVPLTPKASSMLSHQKPDSDAPIWDVHPHYYWRSFTEAKKAVGIKDRRVTPYCTRHTFGTNLARNGVSPLVVAKLMGHTNLTTVKHYIRITDDDIFNAVDTLT